MRSRKNPESEIGRLGRKVVAFERKIADTREQARLSRVAAEQAEVAKRETARLEARGDLTPSEAGKRFEEADATAARHCREVERHEQLADALEAELASRRNDLARSHYDKALQDAEAECDAANQDAERVGRLLAQLAKFAAVLSAARERREAALARARELCPKDIQFEEPANLDEPAWPEASKDLIPFIEAGPTTPLTDTAAVLAKSRAQSEASRRAVIAQYAVGQISLAQVPERDREEAKAARESRNAKTRARQEAEKAAVRRLEDRHEEPTREAVERELAKAG
jgi:hypothetical protein